MKMPKLDKSHRKPVVLGFVIGLLIVGLFGRGIWRNDVVPGFASWRHQARLEAAHAAAASEVNEALKPLGLSVTDTSPASCILSRASLWRTSVYCSTAGSLSVPRILTPPPTATDPAVQRVAASLEQRGWQSGVEKSGLQLLYGYKPMNGFRCMMQVWARSDDGAVWPRLYCSQTFKYLGDPH
jgi:hypothetical protein